MDLSRDPVGAFVRVYATLTGAEAARKRKNDSVPALAVARASPRAGQMSHAGADLRKSEGAIQHPRQR